MEDFDEDESEKADDKSDDEEEEEEESVCVLNSDSKCYSSFCATFILSLVRVPSKSVYFSTFVFSRLHYI